MENKYNYQAKVKEYQLMIINLVDYILFCYNNHFISERTKNELLNIINPDIERSDKHGKINGN